MPRPKKTDASRLTKKIEFRLSQAVYDQLEAQADQLDMSVHQLARELASSKSSKLKIKTHRRSDPELIAQMKRLGNLLNQIAKRMHMTGRISPNLESVCQSIEIIIMRAIDEEVSE